MRWWAWVWTTSEHIPNLRHHKGHPCPHAKGLCRVFGHGSAIATHSSVYTQLYSISTQLAMIYRPRVPYSLPFQYTLEWIYSSNPSMMTERMNIHIHFCPPIWTTYSLNICRSNFRLAPSYQRQLFSHSLHLLIKQLLPKNVTNMDNGVCNFVQTYIIKQKTVNFICKGWY